jgi:hypothetical protein
MVTLKVSKYVNKMIRMTNIKAQIPNECQMPNAKTNNHERGKGREAED